MPLRRSNLWLILVIAMAFASPFLSSSGSNDAKTAASNSEADLGTWTRRIHLSSGRRTTYFPHPEHSGDLAFTSPFSSATNDDKGDASVQEPELGTWGRHLHLNGGRRTEYFPHPEHSGDLAFALPHSSHKKDGKGDASVQEPELGTWGRHLHLNGGRRTEYFPHHEHSGDLAFALPHFSHKKDDKGDASVQEPELGTWGRHLHLNGGRRTEYFPHPEHQ
eukprot:Skav223099  [mRNA]  locus=scaffold419:600981:602411:+ [translate_table: standard]